MSARRAIGLLVSVAALSGCGGADLPVPAPAAVTPARGSAGQATPVVIQGSGFSALVVQSASGGAPAVNETFRAWLGDVPLQEVRRVDDATLLATVPAGLPVGPGTLRVEGPYGTSGELASAFTVDAPPMGALTATISAAPATVSVGQSITVTLLVQNTGTAGLTGVVPGAPSVTGTGTTGTPAGPTPASLATLAPGASGSFTWTYPTTGAGALAFAGSAAASSVPSGATVSAATAPTLPARVTVERPAALTASLPVSGAAAIGRDFTVSMTVANTGGAAARNVVPGTPTLAPAGLAELKAGTGPVPPSVASLASGASTTFTWTFVAGATPGNIRVSSGATGADANSGVALSSGTVTSGDIVIGAAAIEATLEAAPATVNAGQGITLTLVVRNPGLAAVNAFTVGDPVSTSTDGASASIVSRPSPPPPSVLAAGQSLTLVWTMTAGLSAPATTGNLSLAVPLGGTDAFSGTPISASPTAPATVQAAAGVTATDVVPSASTVSTGQAFAVTLNLAKTGTAAANVTAASLTGAGIACTTPPTFPVNNVGTTLALVWSGCTATTTGTLSASATWVDVNVGTPTATNAVTAALTVQTAAGVTATDVVPSASTVSTGQAFTVTLNLAKTGPAAANVTAASLTGAGIACTTLPTFPVNNVGATLALVWSGCTATTTGTLSASATWVDVNVGTPTATNTVTAALTVQTAAGVTATDVVPSASTVSTGQAFTVTLNLAKTGTAAANVTAASLTGAGIACTTPPTFPVNNVGTTLALVWSGCTATTTGTLSANATWVDVNLGGPGATTNVVTAPLTVQAAAVVTAGLLSSTPAPVPVDATFSITLLLSKTGEARATVNAASLTGPGIRCTDPLLPVTDIPGSLAVTWTACDAFPNARQVPIQATVTWVDENDPGNPRTTDPATGVVDVAPPP